MTLRTPAADAFHPLLEPSTHYSCPPCPVCRHPLTFFSGPLHLTDPASGQRILVQGVSQERCGCPGVRRMVPSADRRPAEKETRRKLRPQEVVECAYCHEEMHRDIGSSRTFCQKDFCKARGRSEAGKHSRGRVQGIRIFTSDEREKLANG